MYVNTTLEQWFSKKQSTVRTSVFDTEFAAMKQGIHALRGLRYKLRMMGILTSSPSYIYLDNMSVVHNTSRPLVLRKKSNSVVMGESLVRHIPCKESVANLMTILYGQKRRYLVSNILYDIHDKKTAI